MSVWDNGEAMTPGQDDFHVIQPDIYVALICLLSGLICLRCILNYLYLYRTSIIRPRLVYRKTRSVIEFKRKGRGYKELVAEVYRLGRPYVYAILPYESRATARSSG
ncbi:hypothetical protein QBC39DRAFT_328585 [Podospora conica]|nr:hypothetical protein QBC39DRAFT_328585 [Schizothecium conicum]